MSSLRAKVMRYPGSYGLNTQEDTITDEETRFGATVTNGVIDSAGKLTSRKDFVLQTAGYSNTIRALFTWRQTDATEVILSADSLGKIYSGTSTLTERASNAIGANIQFAVLGSNVMMAQASMAPILMDEDFTKPGFTGAPWATGPNVVIAAYGRMWAADDAAGGNRRTIWWSNLLDAEVWNAGDAGSINLTNAWPQGQDSIVALAAITNRLIVFGRRSILLYEMPANNNPASMSLVDVISDIGCISRDSVQVTDSGVYFLSDNGIYRIDKFQQTTSLLATSHMSLLYNDDLLAQIAAETATNIRGGYYAQEGYYVLSFPTPNVTFCLQTRKLVPNLPVPVATRWTNAGRPFFAFTTDGSSNWYSGGVNGIHKYTGFTPDGASNAYSLVWSPQWLPFEDETRLKHAKKIVLTLEAASGQAGTVAWSTDYVAGTSRSETFTCDSMEFAENPGVGYVRVALGGSFKVIKPQVTFAITGNQVTIHQAHVFANPGAVKP